MGFDLKKEYQQYVRNQFAKTEASKHADLVTPFTISEQGALIHQGLGIPVLLEPLFIPKQQVNKVARKIELADELLIEILELIKSNEDIRTLLAVSDVELQLLRARSSHEAPLPFWRADMNLAEKQSLSIEFNTDAARGRGVYDDLLNNFSRTKLMQGFFQHHPEAEPKQRLDLLSDIYSNAAEQFEKYTGIPAQQMRVAALIWKDHEFVEEIEYYRDHWRRRGVHAEIVDPRDIEFDGQCVIAKGEEYNFAARWVDLDKIIERKCTGLLTASQQGVLTVYPTLTSGIAGKKAIFEILSDPQYQKYFDADKWQEVQSIIAWTRRLIDREVELPDGSRGNVISFAKANKDYLVIKASVGTEGKEVMIGQDVEQEEWEAQIERVKEESWIVQEHVTWSQQDFLQYQDRQLSTVTKNYDFLPTVTNGKYSTSFSRAADGNVLNFIAGATVALQYYY